jgi:hypothetical protein
MKNIPFQPDLRPALPFVHGAKDYRDLRETLIAMDRILAESGLEDRFVLKHLGGLPEGTRERQIAFRAKSVRLALRYSILLALAGLSKRELSIRVADSHLFQWFTSTSSVDGVRPVSKSTLDRFERLFPQGDVEWLVHELNKAVASEDGARLLLEQEAKIEFDRLYADTTCVGSDIHYPADWVLLRDATRTLMKATALIRAQGLINRMDSPKAFMREMNRLCIEMTHARRKTDPKKMRKAILRKMKKLSKVVERHAKRHLELLKTSREETDWSEEQARQVELRIQGVLGQLPEAVRQAHERIIGGRKVKNEDKILSLYEKDAHVIVRGKAGAEVEFGNALYLAEQADGLIADWSFIKGQPKSDSTLVKDSMERIVKNYGKPSSFAADRGFDSPKARKSLKSLEAFNAICPRSVQAMREALEDPSFVECQTRRASTESRVATVKNVFLGGLLRSEGFDNRSMRITWAILAHNLWKLASMAAENRKKKAEARAAA